MLMLVLVPDFDEEFTTSLEGDVIGTAVFIPSVSLGASLLLLLPLPLPLPPTRPSTPLLL